MGSKRGAASVVAVVAGASMLVLLVVVVSLSMVATNTPRPTAIPATHSQQQKQREEDREQGTLRFPLQSGSTPSAVPASTQLSQLRGRSQQGQACDIVMVTSIGGTYSHEREQEILTALDHNADAIGHGCLHVLADGPVADALKRHQQKQKQQRRPTQKQEQKHVDDGFNLVVKHKQPTYAELLTYANGNATQARAAGATAADEAASSHVGHQHKRDQDARQSPIVVLANADIVVGFDTLLACMDTASLRSHLRNRVFALTRHPWPACPEASGGGSNPKLPQNLCTGTMRNGHRVNSADTFIFAAPLQGVDMAQLAFVQNLRGAENRLLHHIKRAGYIIENPCRQVETYHLHCSAERASRAGMRAPRADRRFHATIPRTHLQCSLHSETS